MKKVAAVILILAGFVRAQEHYEIDVQGKRIPLAFDSKRDVLIIDGEILRKFPALNLAQLLSYLANLNFVNKGLFVADPQMLGFNQEQVLVMIHGLPVNNSQTGHHNFVLPLDAGQIERIEILRGGFSSLFGPSGSAGVINIIPSGGKSVKVNAGSFRTFGGSLSFGNGKNYLAAAVRNTAGYMKGLDGLQGSLQGGARIESSGSLIEIWGGWVRTKFGATNFYAPFPSDEDLERLLGIVKWRRTLGRHVFMMVNASCQLSRDNYRLFRDDPSYYSNLHRTTQNALELNMNAYLKGLSLAAGASGFFDAIDSSGIRKGGKTAVLGRHRRSLLAVFGEISGGKGKAFINTGLRLTAGDARNLSGHFLFGYGLAKGLKLETSLYRSFRIPTYTEMYYADPTHSANPCLRPEITWGFDAGLRSSGPRFQSGIRFFKNRTHEMIDWVWDPTGTLWRSGNIHTGRVTGIDLEGSLSLANGRLKALYTWQTARFSESFQSQLLKYHYYFPEHNLSLFWNWEMKSISLSTALKIESSAKAKGNHRYYLNIRAEKTFRRFIFYVEALNLFNNRAEKSPGLLESPRTFDAGLHVGF